MPEMPQLSDSIYQSDAGPGKNIAHSMSIRHLTCAACILLEEITVIS